MEQVFQPKHVLFLPFKSKAFTAAIPAYVELIKLFSPFKLKVFMPFHLLQGREKKLLRFVNGGLD